MISISKDELLALAKDHGGALVGGNICAKVNGSSVWLATNVEGVFGLTEDGKKFVESMSAKAAKPAKATAKKATSKPVAAAPVVEPAEEAEDDDLLEGL